MIGQSYQVSIIWKLTRSSRKTSTGDGYDILRRLENRSEGLHVVAWHLWNVTGLGGDFELMDDGLCK